MEVCGKCFGTFIKVSEGKRIPCDCYTANRIKYYLSPLGKDKWEVPEGVGSLIGVSGDKPFLIYHPYSKSKDFSGMVAHFLLKFGGLRTYEIVNAYELIEIFLGNHAKHKSLTTLNPEILIITIGHHELPNKHQQAVICNALERQKQKGRKSWVFVFARILGLATVRDYCLGNEFQEISFWTGSKVEKKAVVLSQAASPSMEVRSEGHTESPVPSMSIQEKRKQREIKKASKGKHGSHRPD
jgi:hypothetical protein